MKHLTTAVLAVSLLVATSAQANQLDLNVDLLTSPQMGISELNNQYKVDHVSVDARIGVKGNPYKLTGEYHKYSTTLPIIGKRTGKVLWLGAGRYWNSRSGNSYFASGAVDPKGDLVRIRTGASVPVSNRASVGGEINHSAYIGGRQGRQSMLFPRTALVLKGRYKLNKNLDAIVRYETGNAGRANVLDTAQIGISVKY